MDTEIGAARVEIWAKCSYTPALPVAESSEWLRPLARKTSEQVAEALNLIVHVRVGHHRGDTGEHQHGGDGHHS
ncbi:hypothetical protein ACFV4I_14195 [Nocardiopsis alba]|uniref:hypothetical protein n=1 Tax=Nocardiopsis alba TaxID=53437 RepID=UPI00365DBE45